MSPAQSGGARRRTGRSATILASQKEKAAQAVRTLVWCILVFTIANAIVLSILRPGPMIIGRVVRVILACYLCEKLWHGVNWARTVLGVIYAVSAVTAAVFVPEMLEAGAHWGIVMIGNVIVYAWFAYMLFMSRTVADHFR